MLWGLMPGDEGDPLSLPSAPMASVPSTSAPDPTPEAASDAPATDSQPDSEQTEPAFRLSQLRRLTPHLREEYLVQQGIGRQRSRELVQRADELVLALQTLQVQAKTEGWSDAELREARFRAERDLITEIGPDRYGLLLRSGLVSSTVYVSEASPESEAARAGLLSGDLIVRYAGEPVFSRNDLEVLASLNPGPVAIDIERDGTPLTLKATFTGGPSFETRDRSPLTLIPVDTSGDRPAQIELVDPVPGAAIQVELRGSGSISIQGTVTTEKEPAGSE